MRRFVRVLLVLVAALAAAGWYFVLDGSVPRETDYVIDISELRQLARADGASLPTEIRIEVLSSNEVPAFALRAGASGNTRMTRASFLVTGNGRGVVIEAGMDLALAEEYDQAEGFDDAAWERVQTAMAAAHTILVTHEHPDHIGGLVRTWNASAIAPLARLTTEQRAGLDLYTDDVELLTQFDVIAPLDLSQPLAITPGIAMQAAVGHTPGSVLIFVMLANGREFLFIGDIAYMLDNVLIPADRPRFVRFLMVSPEDRGALVRQLRALHDLQAAEPDVIILPSHDDQVINQLLESGDFISGFEE